MTFPNSVPDIRPRDRVRLVSGGSVMSVERVFVDGAVPFARCIWIGAGGSFHRAYIDMEMLELAPNEEEPESSGAAAKVDTS